MQGECKQPGVGTARRGWCPGAHAQSMALKSLTRKGVSVEESQDFGVRLAYVKILDLPGKILWLWEDNELP